MVGCFTRTAGDKQWALNTPGPSTACPWLHAALAGQHTWTRLVQLQNAGGKVWQVLQGNMKMVAVRRHDLPEPDICYHTEEPNNETGWRAHEGGCSWRQVQAQK